MSTILGYAIGGLFLLGMIVGPGVAVYMVSRDSIETLGFEGREKAVIKDCTSVRNSGMTPRYRRVPVVELKSGQTVRGSMDEIRFLWTCDSRVGDEVEVLYDLNNPKRAKINTFHELWFLPSVLGLLCLAWYPLLIRHWKKKLNRPHRS